MVLESLLQLAAGRVILAWLPPGWPGYGDRWELGATLSASWVLGALGLGLLPVWWVWALVFVVRIATLPGALRPRHERPLGWGAAHAVLIVLGLAGRELGHEWALTLGLPIAWIVTALAVWFGTADRRARALGLAALVMLIHEGLS